MTIAAKRVAINTGGGDAPGLNAVIHGAVYAARGLGWQIFGIRDGYDGFLESHKYPDGGLVELRRSVVREISHLGALRDSQMAPSNNSIVPTNSSIAFGRTASTRSSPSEGTAALASHTSCKTRGRQSRYEFSV
jgi:ATP-dependent phosphofructokinase / diphosphate-dependent phosphofructokinase